MSLQEVKFEVPKHPVSLKEAKSLLTEAACVSMVQLHVRIEKCSVRYVLKYIYSTYLCLVRFVFDWITSGTRGTLNWRHIKGDPRPPHPPKKNRSGQTVHLNPGMEPSYARTCQLGGHEGPKPQESRILIDQDVLAFQTEQVVNIEHQAEGNPSCSKCIR